MNRARAFAGAPERAARWVLSALESQLALASVVLLVVALVAAAIWWSALGDVRNLVLVLAAVVGLPFLIWRSRVADRQAEAAEKALLDTRFDRAIQMIESPLATVREAGRTRIAEIGRRYHQEYGEEAMLLLDDEFDAEEVADDGG